MHELFDTKTFAKDYDLTMNSQKYFPLNYLMSNNVSRNYEKKNGRILIVEDDNEVRNITSTALNKEGYEVFVGEHAESAKKIFSKQNADFNLCLIDLGLPDMNGAELAIELLCQQKNLKILFTNGQDESNLTTKKDLITKLNFLKKPYRIIKLINRVQASIASAIIWIFILY